MWCKGRLAEKFRSLRQVAPPDFGVGTVVARGFADLGHEEFLVLPANRMVSLFSGSVTPVPDDQREHFFRIFSPDELFEQLHFAGASAVALENRDGRRWICRVQAADGERELAFEGRELREVLADALLGLKGVSDV